MSTKCVQLLEELPVFCFSLSPQSDNGVSGKEKKAHVPPLSLRRVHAHATIEAPKPDRTVPFLPLFSLPSRLYRVAQKDLTPKMQNKPNQISCISVSQEDV